MDLKEIKAIIDLMRKNDLSVFKIEEGEFKLTLKKGPDLSVVAAPAPAPAGPAPAANPAANPAPAPPSAGPEITSPMVGTFYRSASPEASPYVEVGDEVKPDSVVCIIEAMKVMNEIKAETGGIIAEILVENGKPVQFGEPLFRLR